MTDSLGSSPRSPIGREEAHQQHRLPTVPQIDDPHLLTAFAHRALLLRAASEAGRPFNGLAASSKPLGVSNWWKRKLRHMDAVLGHIEKTSAESVRQLLVDFDSELLRVRGAWPAAGGARDGGASFDSPSDSEVAGGPESGPARPGKAVRRRPSKRQRAAAATATLVEADCPTAAAPARPGEGDAALQEALHRIERADEVLLQLDHQTMDTSLRIERAEALMAQQGGAHAGRDAQWRADSPTGDSEEDDMVDFAAMGLADFAEHSSDEGDEFACVHGAPGLIYQHTAVSLDAAAVAGRGKGRALLARGSGRSGGAMSGNRDRANTSSV